MLQKTIADFNALFKKNLKLYDAYVEFFDILINEDSILVS